MKKNDIQHPPGLGVVMRIEEPVVGELKWCEIVRLWPTNVYLGIQKMWENIPYDKEPKIEFCVQSTEFAITEDTVVASSWQFFHCLAVKNMAAFKTYITQSQSDSQWSVCKRI